MLSNEGRLEKFLRKVIINLPTDYCFLLTAFCLLILMNGVYIEEVEFLSCSLVETLAGSFSFCGDFTFDLRLCLGLAMGLQRALGALRAFNFGGHSYHVDDLLSGGMERFRRGSYQS